MAWDGYYKALDERRARMEETSIFEDPLNRAKMYQVLLEMQAMAYNFVIAPGMTNPRLQTNTGSQADMYTLGLNSPDFHYGVLFLDGAQTYRLRGWMGDSRIFLIQVQINMFGEEGNRTIGNYGTADMDVALDGTFEGFVGGARQPRNWIPLASESGYQFLLVRRALLDWGNSDKRPWPRAMAQLKVDADGGIRVVSSTMARRRQLAGHLRGTNG